MTYHPDYHQCECIGWAREIKPLGSNYGHHPNCSMRPLDEDAPEKLEDPWEDRQETPGARQAAQDERTAIRKRLEGLGIDLPPKLSTEDLRAFEGLVEKHNA